MSFLKFLNKYIISEGGADGHMSHLYEIADITLGDLRDIFTDLFSNNIKMTEKTDGQNLNVTFKDGKIKAARNKATLKNPLSIDEVAELFAGRGDVKDAFVNSLKDLQSACDTLSKNEIDSIFNDGLNFMSIEIIYPPTKNVIDYNNRCLIQFHGINKFNDKFDKIGQDDKLATKLYTFLKKKNAINQSVFEITKPTVLKIKKSIKAKDDLALVLSKLADLAKGVGYNITLEQYVKEKIKPIIIDTASDVNIYVSANSVFVDKLADRFSPISSKRPTKNDLVSYAKAENINTKDSNYKELLSKLAEMDKTVLNESMLNIEQVIVLAGSLLISNLVGFVSADRSAAAQKLSDELTNTIESLRSDSKLTSDQLKKLELNLNKLKKFGETPTGIEGIVFVWKDRVIKMTANFGPINQILGLLRYTRPTNESEMTEAVTSEINSDKPTLALIAGSFKPPHAGHLDMVLKYADKADKVKILISNPQSAKSLRLTKNGKVITPELSKKIWEIYIDKYNLRDKVTVEVSDVPSPITAISKFIDDNKPTENIILGVSTKDNDATRFKGILKYFAEDPSISIIDPIITAVEPYKSNNGEEISASTIRDNIDNLDVIKTLLPSKLSTDDILTITSLLGESVTRPFKKFLDFLAENYNICLEASASAKKVLDDVKTKCNEKIFEKFNSYFKDNHLRLSAPPKGKESRKFNVAAFENREDIIKQTVQNGDFEDDESYSLRLCNTMLATDCKSMAEVMTYIDDTILSNNDTDDNIIDNYFCSSTIAGYHLDIPNKDKNHPKIKFDIAITITEKEDEQTDDLPASSIAKPAANSVYRINVVLEAHSISAKNAAGATDIQESLMANLIKFKSKNIPLNVENNMLSRPIVINNDAELVAIYEEINKAMESLNDNWELSDMISQVNLLFEKLSLTGEYDCKRRDDEFFSAFHTLLSDTAKVYNLGIRRDNITQADIIMFRPGLSFNTLLSYNSGDLKTNVDTALARLCETNLKGDSLLISLKKTKSGKAKLEALNVNTSLTNLENNSLKIPNTPIVKFVETNEQDRNVIKTNINKVTLQCPAKNEASKFYLKFFDNSNKKSAFATIDITVNPAANNKGRIVGELKFTGDAARAGKLSGIIRMLDKNNTIESVYNTLDEDTVSDESKYSESLSMLEKISNQVNNKTFSNDSGKNSLYIKQFQTVISDLVTYLKEKQNVIPFKRATVEIISIIQILLDNNLPLESLIDLGLRENSNVSGVNIFAPILTFKLS